MIVAVAVIAAVIYMIPKGTQTLQASVTTGATFQAVPPATPDGTASIGIGTGVVVNVFSNDERRDPITGATVTLTGLGAAISFQETSLGTYTSVAGTDTATLAANVDEGYLKLIVRAPGYENFEDVHAVIIVRA